MKDRSVSLVAWNVAWRVARIVALFAILGLIVVIVKIPWVLAFRTDGVRLMENAEADDVLTRRAYLVSCYREGLLAPSRMPSAIGEQFQGEWAIGTCSMMAAALTNIAFQFPETRQESMEVVRGLIGLALTPEFRKFDTDMWREDSLKSLDGNNGHIGYLGHLNLLFAAYRFLGGDREFEELHRKVNAALARRLGAAAFPCLATYPGETYTADNVVVVASITLADRLFGEDHSAIAQRWLTYTRKRLLDPRTGLVVFLVGRSGEAIGPSRGSGVGWNSFYLPFIDTEFASDQYTRAKAHLIEELAFGAKGFREYARGVEGEGDIDSGPVVFGLSTAGTGFIVAGARHARDEATLTGLLLTAEVAGCTVQWDGKRRYLFAPLVGDAIMLAMKTAQVWDSRHVLDVLTTHRQKGIMITVKRLERWGLFEWDPDKAAANERKHGIGFEDASDQGEERVGVIGLSPLAHPFHPLYVVAKDLGENHWRMISARLATKQERQRFED